MRRNRSVLFALFMVVSFLLLIGSCDQGLLGPEELVDEDTVSDPAEDTNQEDDETLTDPRNDTQQDNGDESGSDDPDESEEPAIIVESLMSTFENDVEGWTYIGDSGSSVTFVSEGGNPGGFLRHLEAATGIHDWLVAPEKFLGDMSAYYGGVLRYDLRTDILTSPLNAADDIKLIGGEITLYHRHEGPPTINIWHEFTVNLTGGSHWTVGSPTGPHATDDQMLTVLTNLTAIHIRADYRTGQEQIDLDNFLIEPPVTA